MTATDLHALAPQLGIDVDEASERTARLYADLLAAVESLPSDTQDAARLLLGMDATTQGRPLTVRRKRASELLSLSPESLRRHREPRLVDQIASALLLQIVYRRRASPDELEPSDLPDGLRDPKRVMIVGNHQTPSYDGIAAFLRALDLSPVTSSEILTETGLQAQDTVHALKAGMDMAQAALVMLGPEDRPRPNIFIELGMAMALAPTRTVLVTVGEALVPSDLAGVSTLRLTNSSASRNALRVRLIAAGCAVRTHDDRWLELPDGGNLEVAD